MPGMCPMDNGLMAETTAPAQQRGGPPPGFYEMVDDLKSIVRGAHMRAQLKVNTEMLLMYWEIGRTILQRKTRFELDFYAQHAVHHGWSRDRLSTHIRSGLHLAQGAAANNFGVTLPEASDAAEQVFKDPYRLDFTQLSDTAAERDLEDALVTRIVQFLTERGFGFAFVGRQYPLTVGDTEFRIDLLFYHFRLHRFVVVELKTTKAQPSHLGQLSFYVTAVDRLLRDPERDDRTLGILIAESKDETVVEFALQSQNEPLAVSTYAGLPSRVRALMPSSDDLSRIAQEVLHGEG